MAMAPPYLLSWLVHALTGERASAPRKVFRGRPLVRFDPHLEVVDGVGTGRAGLGGGVSLVHVATVVAFPQGLLIFLEDLAGLDIGEQLPVAALVVGLNIRNLAEGNRHLGETLFLSLIHISEPTRRTPISYAVFCLK